MTAISIIRRCVALVAGAGTLAGCVSMPQRVDPAAEYRAADNPDALIRIANAAIDSGDASTATSFYSRALLLRPGDPDAALGEARALTEQDQTDAAIGVLRDAIPGASGASRSRIVLALGKLLVVSHQPNEATRVFDEGLRHDPRSSSLLVGRGVALDASRNFAAAQASYRQALAVEPDSAVARNDLALSLALAGQTRTAISMLTDLRAEEAGGASAGLRATIDGNLALVYAMDGDVERAKAADAGASTDEHDLLRNSQFYSVLAAKASPHD